MKIPPNNPDNTPKKRTFRKALNTFGERCVKRVFGEAAATVCKRPRIVSLSRANQGDYYKDSEPGTVVYAPFGFNGSAAKLFVESPYDITCRGNGNRLHSFGGRIKVAGDSNLIQAPKDSVHVNGSRNLVEAAKGEITIVGHNNEVELPKSSTSQVTITSTGDKNSFEGPNLRVYIPGSGNSHNDVKAKQLHFHSHNADNLTVIADEGVVDVVGNDVDIDIPNGEVYVTGDNARVRSSRTVKHQGNNSYVSGKASAVSIGDNNSARSNNSASVEGKRSIAQVPLDNHGAFATATGELCLAVGNRTRVHDGAESINPEAIRAYTIPNMTAFGSALKDPFVVDTSPSVPIDPSFSQMTGV